MDDQKSRRLFIAFTAFLLGMALGGGLVMFCSKNSGPDQPVPAAARPQTR